MDDFRVYRALGRLANGNRVFDMPSSPLISLLGRKVTEIA